MDALAIITLFVLALVCVSILIYSHINLCSEREISEAISREVYEISEIERKQMKTSLVKSIACVLLIA